ncbi:MAG: hypothetical protein V2A58_09515 [Planctomycetota bacterium]
MFGRSLAAVLVVVFYPVLSFAHLCNDVFAQAQDNLAVKVDIRDGQLRIGEEAAFRVYLLNTMDRDIANINLEVASNEFGAEVRPSPSWNSFPVLRTTKSGGSKEYFSVRLRRKPGVPDGKYAIDLKLVDGQNRSRVLKALDVENAADVCDLPKAAGVRIDGKADGDEWRSAYLCAAFHDYVARGNYHENRDAREQSRFRVSVDDQFLYCLLGFQTDGAPSLDETGVYVAASPDERPVVVWFERVTGRVACERGTDGIEVKSNPAGNLVECRIPRRLLGIMDAKTFYLNFTRTVRSGNQETVSYWRGNKYSVLDPIVYGQFKIAE